ncbi:MAG TPA: hypothetical protein VK733_03085 [Gemmatimonadaceae bacterium]|jgi:hypothetical protein|nr:hypothetical protein [Gemmatimonadaceae bacterium]
MSASILALIRQAENPCARATGDVEGVKDIPVRGARLRADLDWSALEGCRERGRRDLPTVGVTFGSRVTLLIGG